MIKIYCKFYNKYKISKKPKISCFFLKKALSISIIHNKIFKYEKKLNKKNQFEY